ncbi:calcium-binding protein [Enterovirga rhinocerotis]|uniref:Hemolysin type calcium-binding protein n=1 Tax=Enterovirga rhinocerotis TaxID=1339210 RepID=A0A4R7C925_9HYPH|nr:hypothetical protein [Enterovirga rhinocerotis]TDR94938.1 hypothetical protein EV668_2230 [Enterovirga rhinocerotis]
MAKIPTSAKAAKTMSSTLFQNEDLKTVDLGTIGFKPKPINDVQYDYHYGTAGNDHIDAGAGPDYVTAGAGNDYILAGNNNSDWFGSGNEFTAGATVLDGGAGNDTIQVWADRGAFSIITGDGDDHVLISDDADYVRIDNYGDTGNLGKGDVFEFGMAFSGKAVIWSFDQNDRVHLNGIHTDESKYSDWVETTSGGTTWFSNNVTGGVIEVQHTPGVDVTKTGVDNFGPTAQFPYGGWLYFVDWHIA